MANCAITGEAFAGESLANKTNHHVVNAAGIGVAFSFTKDSARPIAEDISPKGAAQALRSAADKLDPPAAAEPTKKK